MNDLSLAEVSVITMHKSPVNSLSLETLTELREAISEVEGNRKCQGLILTSVNENFSLMNSHVPRCQHLNFSELAAHLLCGIGHLGDVQPRAGATACVLVDVARRVGVVEQHQTCHCRRHQRKLQTFAVQSMSILTIKQG